MNRPIFANLPGDGREVIGRSIREAMPIPQDDAEARDERRILHRIDLQERVKR